MTTLREAAQQALEAKSLAGVLLREHDNIEQAIRYAERMAQRCADSRSLMAMEYQDAAKELKAWLRRLHAERDVLLKALKYVYKELRKYGRQHWSEAVRAQAAIKQVEEKA